MKYILGIDSGGTKYLVRACTPEGGVVAEYVGPPAPHYRLEREEVIKRVNANIDACLAKFGGSRKECVYLVCGTTGLDTDRDQQAVEQAVAANGGNRAQAARQLGISRTTLWRYMNKEGAGPGAE